MTDLPKIAMQRLHEKGAAAGIHPDPNLVSAFIENALSSDARVQILEHLAQCVDCREVVFLSTPDQAATAPAAVSAPSRWLTWPVLRWGAAVAAVVVVVAAVSLHRQSGGKLAPSGVIQMTDAPIAKEKAPAAPLAEEKREVAARAEPAPVAPAPKNDSLSDADIKRADQFKKQGSRVAASPPMAQKAGAVAGSFAGERKDELDKTQTVAVMAAQPQAQLENAPAESSQLVPGRAKDAAAGSASGAGGGVGAGTGPRAAAAFRSHPAMLSAMASPRWTLTSDGTLQRSIDFGRSWQTVQMGSSASFRALAANGRDIWVGGSKGALYHSTDAGQNWVHVQPVAAGQVLTDDIIGVEFPDALHGKVTTAGKETWITEDGGQTWRKQ